MPMLYTGKGHSLPDQLNPHSGKYQSGTRCQYLDLHGLYNEKNDLLLHVRMLILCPASHVCFACQVLNLSSKVAGIKDC